MMKRTWLIVATLGVSVWTGSNQLPAAEAVVIDLTQWTPPDISKVGEDPFGELVKYGHALFTDTPNEIGPEVSDAAKRFAGNNLSCSKLPSEGRHTAVCYAHDGCLGSIPTIPRAGGRGRFARRAYQRLHGAEHEWPCTAA